MKLVYRGPGDSVDLDGLTFKKGETADATADQYERLLRSDPDAVVEVVKASGATLDEALRIRESQNKQREKNAKTRESEAKEQREREVAVSGFTTTAAPSKREG